MDIEDDDDELEIDSSHASRSIVDLENNESETFELPARSPCIAHTLNLVGSVDSLKVPTSKREYWRRFQSSVGKMRRLWMHASHSKLFSDKFQEQFKKCLLLPNATRWNSTYDALKLFCDEVIKDTESYRKFIYLVEEHRTLIFILRVMTKNSSRNI
jgi:UDP-2,3-diacylglucosamine pyrophosphatase LpxH